MGKCPVHVLVLQVQLQCALPCSLGVPCTMHEVHFPQQVCLLTHTSCRQY